ncbi:hypothetical protein CVT24_010994 [Panaeolus cyanescens]|uniref:Uncharacterized protein n=1 Tax=Panaeolus cyanescens TaxID=181874 RepID=A0A409WDZ4_9AGAR|nr:hypothetical protein CVT24_010994 [Panaeolus cyanescens]
MSTASVTLPADLPTFDDVDCLLKLVLAPKGSFNMRLLYLNSAADAALLWRPHADILRNSKEHVQLVCDIRSAYYKLESEAKYSLNQPVREFKFPKHYHLIAEFTKALTLRPRDTSESPTPAPNTPNTPSTAPTAPTAPAVVAAPTAGPNVPTEPAADRNNGNRRARSSRTKTPKYVPEGADDSDIDIAIPKDVSTVAAAPKGPASTSDGDVVMSDAATTEAPAASTSPSNSIASEPKGSCSGTPSASGPSSKSASSSTPAKAELKSLPSFRSSGLGKRSRLDDSASLGARNAVADLEAEVKYLDVRISVLTRTRDHLRALIDAL